MQEFQPDVIIANAIWPAGAYVADRLNIPKVAFSVVAPFGPVVNVPSATAAWPSLGPVLPHWLPQPLVGELSCGMQTAVIFGRLMHLIT